jgi:hypothetical protein
MRVAAAHSVENAYWTSIANALDAQSSPGQALIYSGTCPARGVAVSSGNHLICTFLLQKPCAASIANGILTLNTIAYAMVTGTDAHSFARFQDGSGNWVMDLDTGVINTPLADGSLAAWQFNMASYSAGSLLVPSVLTLSFPA